MANDNNRAPVMEAAPLVTGNRTLLDRLASDFADGVIANLKTMMMLAVHADYSNDEIALAAARALSRANLAFLHGMKDPIVMKVLEEQAMLQDEFLKERRKI